MALFGYGKDGLPDFFDHLFGDAEAFWARRIQKSAPSPEAGALGIALAAWRAKQNGHPMPGDTTLALASQVPGLTGRHGLIIPPQLRVALGLPPRLNRLLPFIEAACREGLAAAEGDDPIDPRILAKHIGVSVASLYAWRRDHDAEYSIIAEQAKLHADWEVVTREQVLEFAGTLPIWPPETPALLGLSKIPLGNSGRPSTGETAVSSSIVVPVAAATRGSCLTERKEASS